MPCHTWALYLVIYTQSVALLFLHRLCWFEMMDLSKRVCYQLMMRLILFGAFFHESSSLLFVLWYRNRCLKRWMRSRKAALTARPPRRRCGEVGQLDLRWIATSVAQLQFFCSADFWSGFSTLLSGSLFFSDFDLFFSASVAGFSYFPDLAFCFLIFGLCFSELIPDSLIFVYDSCFIMVIPCACDLNLWAFFFLPVSVALQCLWDQI